MWCRKWTWMDIGHCLRFSLYVYLGWQQLLWCRVSTLRMVVWHGDLLVFCPYSSRQLRKQRFWGPGQRYRRMELYHLRVCQAALTMLPLRSISFTPRSRRGQALALCRQKGNLKAGAMLLAPAEHGWFGDCSHNHVQCLRLPRVWESEVRTRKERCVLLSTLWCEGQGPCRSGVWSQMAALENAALAGYDIRRA